MKVELLSITPDAECLIESVGRICWKTEPTEGGPGLFIKKLIGRGHLSVIEHAGATFYIDGISRACSHQLVRHRIASYSQESQRYVDIRYAEFVVPKAIENDLKARILWKDFIGYATIIYEDLRKLGIRKEDARFVLPNATQTRIAVTMNFRELRHFFEVRCAKDAQWEIRELAKRMLVIVYENAPNVFGDLFDEFCCVEF